MRHLFRRGGGSSRGDHQATHWTHQSYSRGRFINSRLCNLTPLHFNPLLLRPPLPSPFYYIVRAESRGHTDSMVNFQRGNDFRQITPYFLVTTGKKRNRGVSSSRIFISSLHHPTCEINDEKRSSPFRASDQFLDFFAYHSSWMDKKFGGGGREGRERLQSSSRNEAFPIETNSRTMMQR